MSFALEDDPANCWDYLNPLLRFSGVSAFYGISPLDGRKPSNSKQDAAVKALERAKERSSVIDSTYYDWEAFMPRAVEVLRVRALCTRYPTSIPVFVEKEFEQMWLASSDGEILQLMKGMEMRSAVEHLLSLSPGLITKLSHLLVWYRLNQSVLHAVNYSAALVTFIANPVVFLDAYLLHLEETGELKSGSLSLNSPAWYAFVKKARDNHSIKLLPTEAEIADGEAVMREVRRIVPQVYLKRPPAYNGWGFQEKFLWDLEFNKEFRDRTFQRDLELKSKYDLFGGVTDELISWLRSRE